jgi:hypothetical protein|nr:MAG TPA: hypothetical protein [Caudoviricetes sp.]DAQ91750.1 MAG TPA: hypothetical protein [Caudoviricetes sp.]
MTIDLNKYEYEGWYEGVPGDDTAYALLFDKENSYHTYIQPMEIDEAKSLYDSLHNTNFMEASHDDETASVSNGNGKLVLLAALMGGGLYMGFESGAFRKAGNWIKSKIRKGNRSKDKAE